MKIKTIILSVLVLLSSAVLSAQGEKSKNLETIVFDVPMTCEACKKAIEGQLSFEKGVKDLDVFLKDNKVSVTYDKTKTDLKKLQASFAKIGRKATVPTENQLSVADSNDATVKKGSCCKSGDKDAKAENCSDAKKKEKCSDEKKAACAAKKEGEAVSTAQKKSSCCSDKNQTAAASSKKTATKARKRPESCCR